MSQKRKEIPSGKSSRSAGRGTPSRQSARAAKQRAKMVRKRRRQRRRVVLSLLILLLFAGVAFLGMTLVRSIRGGSFESVNQPYSLSTEFNSTVDQLENLRAESFSANLCIVDGDVTLENATLEADQAGLLLDLTNQEVLYSQHAFTKVYPASITKIMTAIVAFEYGNMEDTVTISQENITLESGAQVVGFYAGDRATMWQLMNCLLVYSGNDAASAIAEHIGGSEENFVAMMNAKAKSLGMVGTHFTNPHGLTDEEHYTTPYDIYLMLQEAYKYSSFAEISQLSSYTITFTRYDGSTDTIYMEATDHYLTGEAAAPKDVTILGGKTGTTSLAGNCLAILSQNAYGQPYVSIVMGADSKEILYDEMNSLLQNING